MGEQELEFKLYKEGKLLGMQVSEWTDEMKWWAIANDKSLAFDPATLSNDMVIRGLKERHENVFIPEVINSHDIPEDVYVDYINNAPDGAKWMDIFGVEQMSDCEALQTHDIMLALCLRQPLYMELLDDTDIEFTDDDYFKIADVYFTDEEKRKHIEWDDQPMADRHWQIVAKEHIDIDDLISRDDCPRYVFEEWLSTATRYDIAKLPSISGKDLYLYFQHNNNEYDIKELLGKGSNSCKCPDLETLLKLDGSYIKYIKNPKVGLCKAAIDNDPHNIKYIDVKSDNVYLYALEKNTSVATEISKEHMTSKVREFLGMPEEDIVAFPADYYVVKLCCNLADEGNLHKVTVIPGKEMSDFLRKEFKISFGNLENDDVYLVKDKAQYEPITAAEYALLKRIGLDNVMSGYFNFAK